MLARSSRFNAWESVANERRPKSGTDSYDAEAMKAGKYERGFIPRYRLFHENDSKWIVVGHYGDIE